jgi:hypothetical protein
MMSSGREYSKTGSNTSAERYSAFNPNVMSVTCHAATDVTIANKDLHFIQAGNVVRANTFVTMAVLLFVP